MNQAPLLFTVSGLRGIVGQSLFPATVTQYASALGTFCQGGRVVIARDTRASGEMLKMAAISALISTGCEVIDIGITPTPTVGLAVRDLKAAGGITVTASHNPIEWNALKLFNRKGRYLSSEEVEAIKNLVASQRYAFASWDRLGQLKSDETQINKHIRKILGLKLVKRVKIKRRKFKVVLDGCNGAGFVAGPELLRALGCKTVKINCENTGRFPRGPEPVAKNLTQLEKAVKKNRADIGFALDPDADRLAIVSEQGMAIGEEYTLALAVDYVLGHRPGKVVTNISTSRLVEEAARKYNCPVEKTKVGEANVGAKLEEIKGVIGGEGNGGVILPELHYTRDALLGMALILSHLAESRETITSLAQRLPKYYMIKEVVEIDSDFDFEARLNGLRQELSPESLSTLDGIKFDFNDGWLQIRRSNTEPVVRIIAEAKEETKARELIQKALQALKDK